MKNWNAFVASRLAAGVVAAALLPACPGGAHVLGGGGRPSSSGTGASGGSSGAADGGASAASPSDAAWSKLDPTPGTNDAAAGGLSPQFQAMRANCAALDASLRAACEGQVDAAAAAAREGAQAINDISAANSGNGDSGGKLDRARAAEAARLKNARADCDAQDSSQRDECYARVQIDHEKWHELNEPIGGASEMTDFKKLREAREKCLKLPEAKKRRQCLKDLNKKKRRSTPPATPDPGH